MGADFSGYATKNNLVCADGLTIGDNAFKHSDKSKVPLLWQHQHSDAANVLGHAMLENREDGVYAYGYFNDTPAGKHAKSMVKHGDINSMSIYANNLTKRGSRVIHGDIREVSLVLAGANPGALIDKVFISHGADLEQLEDEAIIYTGLELKHSADSADGKDEADMADTQDTSKSDSEKTVKDVFDAMTDEQKDVVYFMIGQALEDNDDADNDDAEEATHSAISEIKHSLEGLHDAMTRNVFDAENSAQNDTLSHAQLKEIMGDAQKFGSFKESFLQHAQEYGIQDIDILFPDAKLLANDPQIIGRRQEWVAGVINGVHKSPFARVKSVAADLTADEARAKGYVKGNLKKEEVIKLLKRVTTPTTIYKKQKLDRDDIVDITDLDVVAWLKAEMRMMLDEELGRAILIGDGREVDDPDKIDEDHIRPIANDVEMYAHPLTLATNAGPADTVEGVLRGRTYFKGSGTPNFYTTDAILTDLLLQKDKIGRRLYNTVQDLAAAMRVGQIITVEAMESVPNLLGIIVNLSDYTLGADKGGSVSMFDDFDIDYNQYKYLLETRVSGALTKPKSAIVVKRAVGNIVSPEVPDFNSDTNTLTVPTQAGVIFRIEDEVVTGQVPVTGTVEVTASPASGYTFPANTTSTWTFVAHAG